MLHSPNGRAKVAVFREPGNTKLTADNDFARAEDRPAASLADLRVASSVDVHAFSPGDHVMWRRAYPARSRCTGHSDADGHPLPSSTSSAPSLTAISARIFLPTIGAGAVLPDQF
jgi:hypothetical protein